MRSIERLEPDSPGCDDKFPAQSNASKKARQNTRVKSQLGLCVLDNAFVISHLSLVFFQGVKIRDL